MRWVRFRDETGYVRIGQWAAGTISAGARTYAAEDVDVLPPGERSKIIAVGTNHKSAIQARGVAAPEHQRLFFKPPHTIVGHRDTIVLPADKESVTYEAELGVVIGEQCKDVPAAEAMSVVEGFTCVNDLTNMDDKEIDPGGVRYKGFDCGAAVGPVVAPPDDVPDDARIKLFLNGEKRQDAPRSELLFGIPEIIEEVTAYLTLEEHDIIATGSPAGIGACEPGDTVVVEVEGVGQLENTIAAAAPR